MPIARVMTSLMTALPRALKSVEPLFIIGVM